jgi:nitroreductase
VSRAADLHPLLRSRFSPIDFDPGVEMSDDEEATLLEAARWAPSAGNSQPWGFVFARRGDARHDALVEVLAPSSRRWAPSASALVVNLVHRRVEGTDWAYSEFAEYDVGQAVAHLTLQAHHLGFACRQFRAFDLESLTDLLRPRDGWDVLTMIAIGRPVTAEPAERTRRDLSDLTRAAVHADDEAAPSQRHAT